MLLQFSSVEDAMSVLFKNNEDQLAKMAAFDYLEKRLPQSIRDEMNQKAAEILKLNQLTPNGFNKDGVPLYTAEQLATNCDIPLDEVISGMQLLQQLHPNVDVTPINHPTLKILPISGKMGKFVKTEEIDEEGEPIYLCDARATLQLVAEEIFEGNSKGVQILNQYCALAKQHGCPQKAIDRLKQAAHREGGKGTYLKWLDRVVKYAPEESVLSFFNNI